MNTYLKYLKLLFLKYAQANLHELECISQKLVKKFNLFIIQKI